MSNATQSRTNLSGRRIVGIAVGSAALVGAIGMGIVGSAGAKEIGSGGTVGGVTAPACSPVTSLKYKGDATTADTGLATISVDYVVKSCDGNAVTADVVVYESATPSNVLFDVTNTPLSYRFTTVVRPRVSYQVKVTVHDAVTGATVGSQTIFAAAVPKGV